jgi:hypothetical protein
LNELAVAPLENDRLYFPIYPIRWPIVMRIRTPWVNLFS